MAWAGGQRRRGSALVTTIEPIHGPNMTTSRPGVCTNLCVCVCYCVCVCGSRTVSWRLGVARQSQRRNVTHRAIGFEIQRTGLVFGILSLRSLLFSLLSAKPVGYRLSMLDEKKNQKPKSTPRKTARASREPRNVRFSFRFVFFFWRRIKMPAPIAILSLD